MKGKICHLLMAVICITAVFSASDNANATVNTYANDTYVSEFNYEETMSSVVLPYIEEIRSEGYIKGEAGMKLHYEKFITSGAKDSIVIIHGISEASEKFYEFIYDLSNKNYNVYFLECRGHGNSDRFSTNMSKVDMDNWENVVKDQKTFVDSIVKPDMQEDGKLLMYAHSFGGCVGTTYLEMYTNDFDAAIINCPLYGYELGYPNVLANIVTSGLTMAGRGSEYVPGYGPFNATINWDYALSSSETRIIFYNDQRVLDESQHTYSPTNRFFSESCKMIDYASSKKNVKNIACPVLLVSGENDTAVINSKHDKVASYSDNIKHIVIPGANHEIYMESDEILFPYLNIVFDFYNQYR